MNKKILRRLANDVINDHITDIEIIGQAVNELLPKETSRLLFKAVNMCISNKGIRHRAFNAYQIRNNGYSRIN